MTVNANMKRRIEEFVRELEEEFGELPESNEPLITQIEDWSIAIGDAVMSGAMRRKLESQPTGDGGECPTCGRPGLRKGHRRRTLQTRRGDVSVEEIECYCSRCRKSFFPSVSAVGD